VFEYVDHTVLDEMRKHPRGYVIHQRSLSFWGCLDFDVVTHVDFLFLYLCEMLLLLFFTSFHCYRVLTHTSAGFSSRVVSASDCGVRGLRLESRRVRLCLSRQLLRYTALGTGCATFLQSLGLQVSAFNPQWDGKMSISLWAE